MGTSHSTVANHKTKTKHDTGLDGQKAAESFLQTKDHKVLARNFRIKTGEIDLVTKDGEYIVFVEVKTRTGLGYGFPKESVGAVKQSRIIKTALYYLASHGLTESNMRFDVVEVLLQQGQVYVSHIENAFSG